MTADAKYKSVTACVVNYKTEELTRLCLRSIRRFSGDSVDVVVVDNNSADSSLEYLRSLKWIRLIERGGESIRPGSYAQGSALDIALKETSTEFFLAMHSDVVVRDPAWLDMLMAPMRNDPSVACVGSGKLDDRPEFIQFIRRMTDLKRLIRAVSGKEEKQFYIRAICALYRTEVLKKEGLSFAANTDAGITCGQQVYIDLMAKGYRTVAIPDREMIRKIWHLAHATMVLNPEFKVRRRTQQKCRRQIEELFSTPLVKELREDASLDR